MENSKSGGRKGRKFVYHTHNETWGCIYDTERNLEAIVMVNEFNQRGLTRRIANRMNAGTM